MQMAAQCNRYRKMHVKDFHVCCIIMTCLRPLYQLVRVHPRTGHEDPTGEQMYSSTVSLISVLDGGGWSTPRLGLFAPGKTRFPILQERGWAPGQVWTGAENLAPHRSSVSYCEQGYLNRRVSCAELLYAFKCVLSYLDCSYKMHKVNSGFDIVCTVQHLALCI